MQACRGEVPVETKMGADEGGAASRGEPMGLPFPFPLGVPLGVPLCPPGPVVSGYLPVPAVTSKSNALFGGRNSKTGP